MTDALDWMRAADVTRRVGRDVEYHAEIGSTNDRARELLAGGAADGIAVVADLQTAGRGRRGRSWVSPPGRNVMVSVGLRPRLEAGQAGLLGIAAALAVRDAAAAVVRWTELLVRWPNDVVTADGAKLAGLLVETAIEDGRLTEAVIGMGVNVNWRRAEMPAEIAERATSLADLAGGDLDRVSFCYRLLDDLDAQVAALERGESPVERLRAVSALDGRPVTIDLGEERLEGVAAGVAADGSLLLDAPDGRVALASGEVVAVRDLVGSA